MTVSRLDAVGVGGVLAQPASCQPAERVGVTPERAGAEPRALEAEVERVAARFGDGDVPLPPFWGGYRVTPSDFEFWAHRDDRLHDRLRYRSADGVWVLERLAP